jgi:hypothetical protein
MLAMIIAATLAGSDPGAASAPPPPSPPAATKVADQKPAKPKSRGDEVICKTIQDPGIGTTRQACATRRDWDENTWLDQQWLRQRQACSNGYAC